MSPIHISFVIDSMFFYSLLAAAIFLVWFFMPLMMNIPERLGLNKPKVPMFKVVLGVLLALPWVLTAAILSLIAIIISGFADMIFNTVVKMKAKIW